MSFKQKLQDLMKKLTEKKDELKKKFEKKKDDGSDKPAS